MTEHKCKNCRWKCDVTEIDSITVPPFCECHRYAPRMLCGTGTGWSDTKWPQVEPDDWCGDFEEKK